VREQSTGHVAGHMPAAWLVATGRLAAMGPVTAPNGVGHFKDSEGNPIGLAGGRKPTAPA